MKLTMSTPFENIEIEYQEPETKTWLEKKIYGYSQEDIDAFNRNIERQRELIVELRKRMK